MIECIDLIKYILVVFLKILSESDLDVMKSVDLLMQHMLPCGSTDYVRIDIVPVVLLSWQ